MQIKRYEAKNMTLALKMVKEELGPDAVILSARSLRKGTGIFSGGRQQGVEVTAAVDSSHTGNGLRTGGISIKKATPPLDAVQRYRKTAKPRSLSPGDHLERKAGSTRRPDRNRSARIPANRRQAPGLISALRHQLLSQDVERPIAEDLIEEIQRIPGIEGIIGPEQLRTHLKELLEEMKICFHPIGTHSDTPKLIAFVGPPGVGKTTTLAKLAVRHATAGRLKVALIGMDGYRIGAVQELQTYADIINVPLAVLNTPAALRATLKRFKKYDVVYLDTAGIGLRDQQRMQELQAALAKVKNKEVHLLLRANTRDRDLEETIDRFKSLPVSCLGFTHLDECTTCGVLINILSRTKLPLSIMSHGQQIPEDLENGSLDVILDWVLKDFNATVITPKEADKPRERVTSVLNSRARYVANRNSDVYHALHCKWTRKIKLENMIEFATIDEADSQRYLPCRTCKPDAEALDESASLTRDRVTLTGYR